MNNSPEPIVNVNPDLGGVESKNLPEAVKDEKTAKPVVTGVNTTSPPNTPPTPVQEPTQEVSAPVEPVNEPPVEGEKIETPPETPKVIEAEVVEKKVEEKKEELPYNYVICPKCGEEIKEEYFFANKKTKSGGKGLEIGYTVRAEETGDRVFLIHEKKRYWVKNPETLKKLGFNLGDERNIPFSELLQFPEYDPIDLTVPGAEFPRKNEVSPEEKVKQDAGKPYKVWA